MNTLNQDTPTEYSHNTPASSQPLTSVTDVITTLIGVGDTVNTAVGDPSTLGNCGDSLCFRF